MQVPMGAKWIWSIGTFGRTRAAEPGAAHIVGTGVAMLDIWHVGIRDIQASNIVIWINIRKDLHHKENKFVK